MAWGMAHLWRGGRGVWVTDSGGPSTPPPMSPSPTLGGYMAPTLPERPSYVPDSTPALSALVVGTRLATFRARFHTLNLIVPLLSMVEQETVSEEKQE